MLVLSRRPGEEIVIDGDIRVRVVSVQGRTVRLAIAAPPAIRVDRLEIHSRRNFPKPASALAQHERKQPAMAGPAWPPE
jgi:carbon storage regulator